MPRNLTIALDEEVIRRARVVAARRGISMSALVRQELLRLAQEDAAYDGAREAARKRLGSPSRLGDGRLPSREELHDREDLR